MGNRNRQTYARMREPAYRFDGTVESWQRERGAAVAAMNARYVPRLPAGIAAGLFDMDGVLTQTAKVHAAAWKEMFDAYLRQRAQATGEDFTPFDDDSDYDRYVDGKPRSDGVRDFLASRGIELPDGSKDDPPDAETVAGLGNRKNEVVQRLIREQGVEAYPGSIDYVKAARDAGIKTAVVRSEEGRVG